MDCLPAAATGDLRMMPWWMYGFGFGGFLLAVIGFGRFARLSGQGATAFSRLMMLLLGGVGVLLVGLAAWGLVIGGSIGGNQGTATQPPGLVVVTQETTEEPEVTVPPDECGDGYCNTETENSDLCPEDCPCRDNGECEAGEGFSCRDCGDTTGGCGAPCETSDDCPDELSCFNAVCWESCLCGGNCGGGDEDGEGRNCWCEEPTDYWACCDDGSCFDDTSYRYCSPPG